MAKRGLSWNEKEVILIDSTDDDEENEQPPAKRQKGNDKTANSSRDQPIATQDDESSEEEEEALVSSTAPDVDPDFQSIGHFGTSLNSLPGLNSGTKVVGIQYYRGIATGGESLLFVREPQNPYDSNAIRVDNVANLQVGQ